jgi:hypothetical protein
LDDVDVSCVRAQDKVAAGSGGGEGTTTGSGERGAEDESDDSRGSDERGQCDQCDRPPTTGDPRRHSPPPHNVRRCCLRLVGDEGEGSPGTPQTVIGRIGDRSHWTSFPGIDR